MYVYIGQQVVVILRRNISGACVRVKGREADGHIQTETDGDRQRLRGTELWFR